MISLLIGQIFFGFALGTWARNIYTLSISTYFFFYSFGVHSVMISTLTRKIFGIELGPKIFPVMFTSKSLGAFTQWILYFVLNEDMSTLFCIYSS